MNILSKIKAFFKKEEKTDIQKARELHAKLKKEWDKNKHITGGKVIELQEIYPSRGGNLYYVHSNILDLHVCRQMELAKALQGIQFNVDSKELDRWIEDTRKANSGPDSQYLVDQKLTDLELRRKRLPQMKMFLTVAMALIYRHDECPYVWEANKRDAKWREINKDPDLHSFFLSEGYAEGMHSLKAESLTDWNAQSLSDFLDKWRQQELDKAASIG
jgi:hypothetical protein